MAINNDRTRILGDINPRPGTREREMPESERDGSENEESMVGGSRHDRSEHAGSRDVTEGVTGGTGTDGRNTQLSHRNGRHRRRYREPARIEQGLGVRD